jgi:hypothetical protein
MVAALRQKPFQQPWNTRGGSSETMAEEDIRRLWTGDADELVLMHFFKAHGEGKSRGSLKAVERVIHHYREKWRGQDWRRKMYQAVASKYGGADPRVLWLQQRDAQERRAGTRSQRLQHRVAPPDYERPPTALETPPSHLTHLLPESSTTLRQQPAHQVGSSRAPRDPNRLAAAAAIDAFVARQEQKIAAQEARVRDLQVYAAACGADVKDAEGRHSVAVQAAMTASDAYESDPPKISRAERRYIDDDVGNALAALTAARAREAAASKRVALARATTQSSATQE